MISNIIETMELMINKRKDLTKQEILMIILIDELQELNKNIR